MGQNLVALASAEIVVVLILLTTILFIIIKHPRSNKEEFWPGVMLLIIAVVSMLSHAIGITSDKLEFKTIIENLLLASSFIMAAVWSLFIIAYAGYSTWNKPVIVASLSALPIMGVLLIFTNEYHHMVWTSIELNSYNPYFPLESTRGVGAWLIFSLTYLYGIVATIALIRKLVATRHIYQLQSVCLIVVGFIILETGLFGVLNLAKLLHTAVYPSVWAVALSSLVIVRIMPMLEVKGIRPIVRETIVAEMSDLVLVLDNNDKIVDLNLAAQHLFEHAILDVYGKPIVQMLPELSEHLKLAGRKSSKEVELRDNGMARIYDVSVSPLTDIKGGEKGTILVLRDITERKQMEQAIVESEERYRVLIENAEQAICVYQDGKLKFANSRIEEISGYTIDEINAMPPEDLFHPDDHKYINRPFPDYEKDKEILGECSFRIIAKDGRIVWLSRHITDIIWEGRPAFIIFDSDITERKKTERELMLRAHLLDSASDGIYLHDLQGTIIYANEAVCVLRGYTKEEHIGSNLFIPASPVHIANIKKRIKALSEAGSYSFESLYYCKDGSAVPVEIHSRLIEIDGNKLIISIARDISERKKIEDELKLRAQLLDNAHDAIAVRDLDGNYVYVNEMAYESLGYTRKNFLTMNVRDIVSPECQDDIEEIVARTLAKGEHEYKLALICRNGSIKHVETRARLVELFGKKLIISVSRDVTEREKMIQALTESEEKTRIAFDAVAEGITVTDLKANITQVNQSLVEMHGYAEKSELLGRNAFSLMASGERTQALRNIKNTLNNRTTGTREYMFRRRDGSIFPGEMTSTILRDANGAPRGIVATSRDISERKQIEAERRSYRELIDRIIATIPNAVMVVNRYSNIVLANRAFYECFKLNKEHVEGKPMYAVLPVKRLFETVSDIMEGKEIEPLIEFKYTLGTHERIFIGNVLLTRKEEVLVILTDVTIEREKQERLYLTDRLASIGEMSSGIAHELNNPLTSIISLSELLLEEELSPEEKEDIEVINKEAQRAATIVKNLLSFARKHQPVRQLTQINRIIEDVLQLRKYEHKLNNIQVSTCFDKKLPDTMVDYFQMQQVFLNIVLNAENAINENQQQKPVLDITTKKTNGSIRVLFKDNGPGIAPEHMAHIFDPFFTTKGVGKGTGLGLSICYGIVSAHGGKIYAQSRPGQGTTFVVELPANSKNGAN